MKKLYVDTDIDEIIANTQSLHENFEGKSILITGAGGFLGRYFTAVFAKLNESVFQHECRVTALDNFISENNPSYKEGKRSGVNFLQQDVIEPFETDESFDFILHAAGITDTFGAWLILMGLMFQAGLSLIAVKLLMVIGFLILTSPTSGHALAKAAWLNKLKPFVAAGEEQHDPDHR